MMVKGERSKVKGKRKKHSAERMARWVEGLQDPSSSTGLHLGKPED
jgi:hypothetical protein